MPFLPGGEQILQQADHPAISRRLFEGRAGKGYAGVVPLDRLLGFAGGEKIPQVQTGPGLVDRIHGLVRKIGDQLPLDLGGSSQAFLGIHGNAGGPEKRSLIVEAQGQVGTIISIGRRILDQLFLQRDRFRVALAGFRRGLLAVGRQVAELIQASGQLRTVVAVLGITQRQQALSFDRPANRIDRFLRGRRFDPSQRVAEVVVGGRHVELILRHARVKPGQRLVEFDRLAQLGTGRLGIARGLDRRGEVHVCLGEVLLVLCLVGELLPKPDANVQGPAKQRVGLGRLILFQRGDRKVAEAARQFVAILGNLGTGRHQFGLQFNRLAERTDRGIALSLGAPGVAEVGQRPRPLPDILGIVRKLPGQFLLDVARLAEEDGRLLEVCREITGQADVVQRATLFVAIFRLCRGFDREVIEQFGGPGERLLGLFIAAQPSFDRADPERRLRPADAHRLGGGFLFHQAAVIGAGLLEELLLLRRDLLLGDQRFAGEIRGHRIEGVERRVACQLGLLPLRLLGRSGQFLFIALENGPVFLGIHEEEPGAEGDDGREQCHHGGRDKTAMLAGPAPGLVNPRFGIGLDRFVREEMLDVLGHGDGGGIAIGRLQRHRPHDDRAERRRHAGFRLGRRLELAPLHLAHELFDRLAIERQLTNDQHIERGAEAVNVRALADDVQPALGLFGAHERRRADGGALHRLLVTAGVARLDGLFLAVAGGPTALLGRGVADRLGEAPVDHQRLAVLADHDVAGLQVAVQHAATVGIANRVAHIHESLQQVPEDDVSLALVRVRLVVVRGDRLLQGVALDEAHRIVWPAVVVGAEAVHRNNARMLQAASDLGFQHEPAARVLVHGVLRQNLLEGHFAVEFLILGQEHLAQSPLGVRADDPKPPALLQRLNLSPGRVGQRLMTEHLLRRRGAGPGVGATRDRSLKFGRRTPGDGAVKIGCRGDRGARAGEIVVHDTGGGFVERRSGRSVRHAIGVLARAGHRTRGAHLGHRVLDILVADPGDRLARAINRTEAGQRLRNVVVVLKQFFLDQGIEQIKLIPPNGALFEQNLADGAILGARPGIGCPDQRLLPNEAVLNREEAEQQIQVGGHANTRVKRGGAVIVCE